MADSQQRRPFGAGINVPGAVANVRPLHLDKVANPTDPNVLCERVICATGVAAPPVANYLLQRVHVRIYRTSERPPDNMHPPSNRAGEPNQDALARVFDANGNVNWHFDEVPNPVCGNAPAGNNNNNFVVWTVWDHDQPVQDSQPFAGICSNHTDCEPAPHP